MRKAHNNNRDIYPTPLSRKATNRRDGHGKQKRNQPVPLSSFHRSCYDRLEIGGRRKCPEVYLPLAHELSPALLLLPPDGAVSVGDAVGPGVGAGVKSAWMTRGRIEKQTMVRC